MATDKMDRDWQMALRRSVAAKRAMDAAQRALDEATHEYQHASRDLDELEAGRVSHS